MRARSSRLSSASAAARGRRTSGTDRQPVLAYGVWGRPAARDWIGHTRRGSGESNGGGRRWNKRRLGVRGVVTLALALHLHRILLRFTPLVALLALCAFPVEGSAQSEPDEITVSHQIRAAARWPQAASEAVSAGVSEESIQALFRVVRENDFPSRDVRRLVITIAGQAAAWGPEEIMREVQAGLNTGEGPLDLRERLIAGPEGDGGAAEPVWVPGEGNGSGDRANSGGGGERQWPPGTGAGPGNGAGQAERAPDRDWPTRSGEGPGDRTGIGLGAADDGGTDGE